MNHRSIWISYYKENKRPVKTPPLYPYYPYYSMRRHIMLIDTMISIKSPAHRLSRLCLPAYNFPNAYN